jgi:hypothetical protein
MSWERALEADARLAAKNALLIRAALRQSFDSQRAFEGYKNTSPDENLTLPQQRIRARAWAILNIRPNLEPLRQVLYKLWADGYVLGDLQARVSIADAKRLQKAETASVVDWSTWKPGDKASAVLLNPPRAFQRLLANAGITLKGFSDTTLTDIGNAVGEAIELGLDAKTSAKNIMNHVANPARALSIAITEQNRAISTATSNRYLEAGLEKMEWLVFQPCDICAQNANQVVSIGAPFPSGDTQPPAHPHCRCALAPVIAGFDDPGFTGGNIITPEPSSDTTYRMQHQAPGRDGGIPATNIEEGMADATDPKLQMAIYGTGDDISDRETFAVLNQIQNDPDAMVTIYRAVPGDVNTINPGDWVTLSENYANQHKNFYLANENGKVIAVQVRAGDLFTDGNSINEFGYDPANQASMKVSFAGRDIEPEVRKLFETDSLSRYKDKSLVDELEEMRTKDIASGGTQGDSMLKKVVKLQGFDGKPQVVDTVADIKTIAKQTPGKVLYRGIADFSQESAESGLLPLRPNISYSADKAVEDFIQGEYRAGWGAFGSGTYTSQRFDEASGYALSTDGGATGSGKIITMFLPDSVLMPTKEVVKETMREVIRGGSLDWAGGNVGRALAAKGYQAYDVGFLQSDKAGIYVILDRTAVTVAREAK